MSILLKTNSPGETQVLGKKIGGLLQKGAVVGLTGELGAGKTCLVKAILAGLGIKEKYRGSSPTFILINEYQGRLPVYHFDVYRINDAAEVIALGYEEYFYGDGVTLVEWADKIETLLPAGCIRINIKILGEKQRVFEILNLAGRERLNKLW